MPWKETTTMEQKVEFICEWLSEKYSITELCNYYRISRPTAYKLIDRYERMGIEGLRANTRAPRKHPNANSSRSRKTGLNTQKKAQRMGS